MTTRWLGMVNLPPKSFGCGHCDTLVSSAMGFTGQNPNQNIYICPGCSKPVCFDSAGCQFPEQSPGTAVKHLPKEIEKLYDEARVCVAAGAHTAAVLACRKLLMNIAVAQGSKEGASFVAYVEDLSAKGFVPPNGKHWVDHIRKKGNEANHEIALMTAADARELIDFAGMLLKFVYEFPARVPKPPAGS